MMLTDLYLPLMGGLEVYVQNLGVELAARGHQVSVVTLWHEGTAEQETDRGVRIYRIRGAAQRLRGLYSDGGRRFSPPLPDPEATLALRKVIAAERPEVVHGHNWLTYSFLPLKAWSGARLVVSLHDFGLSCALRTRFAGESPCDGPALTKCLSCAAGHYGAARGVPTALANWVMGGLERRMVDMFLPVSQAVADGSGLTGSAVPHRVIHNFLPGGRADHAQDLRPYLDQLPPDGFLLFVGALNRSKGVRPLLDAYAQMTGVPPLVLIGTRWPDTPTRYPENVVVLHDWPHAAVLEAWRRSSMGLVPSVWPEPFGLVSLEAMVAGRPVIGSRIGGITDIVADGETGLLVTPGDPVELRAAIARLLADAPLRERMGAAGRGRVELFRADRILPQIEHVYAEVAGSYVQTPPRHAFPARRRSS
jgi:glycosyltransferase involved in cell wall biosynthesis